MLRLTYSRVFSVISAFQNFGQRILFSFVQLYADMIGATAGQQGVLLSFRNIISFAGQQYFGQASDRIGRISILIGGFLLSALTSFLFIDTRSPIIIIIVFAFYSLGFSAIQPTFSALIGDTYPDKRQAEMLGIVAGVGGLFGGLAFLGVGLLSDYFSNPYRILFASAGISFVFAAIAVLLLWIRHRVPPQEKTHQLSFNLFDPLKYPTFRKFVLIDSLFAFSMATAWPLFPKVTNELATTSQVTIMWAITFIGYSITARYTAQIKKRINSSSKSFFYSRIPLWFVPFSFAFATSWTHLVLARALAGLTFGYYATMQKDYILDNVKHYGKTTQKGWFLGTHSMIYGVATFVGSLLFGNIADYVLAYSSIGYRELFLISAAIRFIFVFGYLKLTDI